MSIILEFWRLGQEASVFQASMGYTMNLQLVWATHKNLFMGYTVYLQLIWATHKNLSIYGLHSESTANLGYLQESICFKNKTKEN